MPKKSPADVRTGETVRVGSDAPRTELASGKKYQVAFKRPFRARLCDEDGQPLVGFAYTLELGTESFAGTLGEDGLVSHELPSAVRAGTLKVWPGPAGTEDQAYVHRLELLT